MKKIMAFALCLTLLLSAFAGGAVAEEDPVVIENMGRIRMRRTVLRR